MKRDNSLQEGEEINSPSSPKRPRTEMMDEEMSRFQFPELLTFRKPDITQSCVSQAYKETFPKQITNIQDQLSSQSINTDSTLQVQMSNLFISDIIETDLLSDLDGAAMGSQGTADTSSHDSNRLRKSVQCEPPVGLSATGEDVEDGARQVQNSGSPIKPVTLALVEEDVRCQADCSYEEAACDEGTDMLNPTLAVSEEGNQKEIQCEFSEKSLCNKEIEDVKNGSSFSHFVDGKSLSIKPTASPSSSLTEVGENDGETLKLQIVASHDRKTEEQFNEGTKLSFSDAAAVGAVAENINVFNAKECEAEKQQTVEKLTIKVVIEAADTALTQASVQVIQNITEGDNDAASFNVIDRAVWVDADWPAEEICSAGFEMSEDTENGLNSLPNTKTLQNVKVKLCGPEKREWLAFQNQEQPQSNKVCLSNTETEPSVKHDQTCDKRDTENHQRPTSLHSSRSATFCSAENDIGASQGTAGHDLEETDQSVSFSGSLDHPEAPTQRDTAKMDKESEIHEAENMSMNSSNGFQFEDVEQFPSMDEDSVETKLRESRNCITDHTIRSPTTSQQINICPDTAVKEREEKIRDQEKASVASEYCEANSTDDQLQGLNIQKIERHGRLEIEENEKKLDEIDQVQTETKDVNNDTIHCAIKMNITDMVESRDNTWQIDTMHESPQLTAHMLNLPLSASLQIISNTQKPACEEKTSEITNADPRYAHFSVMFPSFSDAVVPGINNCGVESQLSDHSSTASHNCNVRFTPAPSAPAFAIRTAAAGFDTFEKIQLSPDDCGVDASGLGNDTLHTCAPCQLLENTPYHSKSQSSTHESERSSDEVEINVSNNTYEFFSGNSSRTVAARPVPTADVIAHGWPDQKPLCESTFQIYDCFLDSTAVSIESDSSECEGCDGHKFEMKKQFDMVLNELKLFFDISASDLACSNGTASPKPLTEIIKASEGVPLKCKDGEDSAEEPDTRETSFDDTDGDCNLECEATRSCVKSCGDEQEVPLGNCKLQASSRGCELKDTEPIEREQRQRAWSPSFMSPSLMEQLTQKLLEPPRRLEPLRTCTRPIRVGLSKRAKTRHLHHPYLHK